MVEVGQIAFVSITNLLKGVIQAGTRYTTLSFLERRKIESRIDDAVAEVVEPLLPFLAQEHIPEDKQSRLIRTCVDELGLLTTNPEPLFQGSLDGQKIFEQLYKDRELPETVVEDGLKDIYTLLCPRIATLLCKIPAAVKDWESEAWSENYRRLDEITTQLRQLFTSVDELATSPLRQADEILSIIRRSAAQKIRFELDLTGLRADRPLEGKFDNFFVHPEIQEAIEIQEVQGEILQRIGEVINTKDDSFRHFTKSCQAIVVGTAGSGKSTWAKWLQRETLTPDWTGISIRVELRRFLEKPSLSLYDLIRETAGKHLAEDATAERIGHWLNTKQVIFILDGFDEIRLSERDDVFDWIIELHSAARGCPFILTSRPLTTDHLERFDDIWQRWGIKPFDEPRIIDYIQRWYDNSPVLQDSDRIVDAEDLASDWRGDPTIEPLTGNPLLLSTLLMVHHLDGNLPSGRSQLYQRYVEGMLGLWDDRRGISATIIQLALEQKRQIIRGFALKLFFDEQDQLDEEPALNWLQAYLAKNNLSFSAPDILALLRERSGLIVGPGIYSFAHKSIAEYLVAEVVLQGVHRDNSGNRIDRFQLYENRNNDRWNTVTFLWAGLAPTNDVEDFIKECIKSRDLALACGILNDQYDRIPADIRRQLLLKIAPLEISWGNEVLFYTCGHEDFAYRYSLAIPSFNLRGLTHSVFIEILFKATEDRTVNWSDCVGATKEFKDSLWICFAQNPNDIDVWKSCLRSPCPENAPSIRWLLVAAERSFIKALIEKDMDLKEIVTVYQTVCSQAKGLVSIVLISVGLRFLSFESQKIDQRFPGIIDNFLEALLNSKSDNIDPDWLLWTYGWIFLPDQKSGVDLFSTFTKQLKKMAEDGYIERNDTYEHAIEYVQELQKRRDALVSEV